VPKAIGDKKTESEEHENIEVKKLSPHYSSETHDQE
jgi:hypothetical protein